MKRTTVFLDDDLKARLERVAQRQGVSFAAVVREALASYAAAPRAAGAMPSVAGRFASGHSDTSERVDELLRHRDPHA